MDTLLMTPAIERALEIRNFLRRAGLQVDERSSPYPGLTFGLDLRAQTSKHTPMLLLETIAEHALEGEIPPSLLDELLGSGTGIAESLARDLQSEVLVAFASGDAAAIVRYKGASLKAVAVQTQRRVVAWREGEGRSEVQQAVGASIIARYLPTPREPEPSLWEPEPSDGAFLRDLVLGVMGLSNIRIKLLFMTILSVICLFVMMGQDIGARFGHPDIGGATGFYLIVGVGAAVMWKKRSRRDSGGYRIVAVLVAAGISLLVAGRLLAGTDSAEWVGVSGLLLLVLGGGIWFILSSGAHESH